MKETESSHIYVWRGSTPCKNGRIDVHAARFSCRTGCNRLTRRPAGSGTIGTIIRIEPRTSAAAGDSLNVDDSDIGWGATVGYRILDYVAAELSYFDLGTLRTREILSLPLIPPDTLELKQELRTSGAAISILGILPVTDDWDVFVRVGVLNAHQELTVSRDDSTLDSSLQVANENHRSNTAL